MPPPRAAVPKAVQGNPVEQTGERLRSNVEVPGKRPVGRPPKPDAFTVLRVIAAELGPLDKAVRRQVLETLLALSE
jgi:hypothetical protein